MPAADPGKFRFVGERDRLQCTFIKVVSATFIDPGGYTFEREIVRHPGAVCAVPLEDGGETVLMVRQYRGALDRFMLEIPAGKRDVPGEPPEVCIRRELNEEVGREAGTITELGSFFNSPGFCDEETFCFLAEDLIPVPGSAHGIEEEHMTVERIPFADVWKLVANGELVDAKSIISLTLAERHLAARRSA